MNLKKQYAVYILSPSLSLSLSLYLYRWMNWNGLTATSLEGWLVGHHPQMAASFNYVQVSEL